VSVVPHGSKRRRKGKAAAVLLLFIPLVAGGYYFGYNTGTVSIQVTDDAISDFQSLNITFSEVALLGRSTLSTAEWTTVEISSHTLDLTVLNNNVSSEIGMGRVQAGTYSQLRLTVASGIGVLRSGEHVTVRFPSGEFQTETPFKLDPMGQVTLVVRILVVKSGPAYSLQTAVGSIQQGP